MVWVVVVVAVVVVQDSNRNSASKESINQSINNQNDSQKVGGKIQSAKRKMRWRSTNEGAEKGSDDEQVVRSVF